MKFAPLIKTGLSSAMFHLGKTKNPDLVSVLVWQMEYAIRQWMTASPAM